MKVTLRVWAIAIVIFVLLTNGCERIGDNILIDGTELAFVNVEWRIVSFGDETIQELEDEELEIIENRWVFDDTGIMTNEMAYKVIEQDGDADDASFTQYIIRYTLTGDYTADEETITVTGQNAELTEVTVTLEPRDFWLENIGQELLEQLESDLADEVRESFQESNEDGDFFFKNGVEYNWKLEPEKGLFTVYTDEEEITFNTPRQIPML